MSNFQELCEAEAVRAVESEAIAEEWNERVRRMKTISTEALTVPGCGTKAEVDALLVALSRPENEALGPSSRRLWRRLCERGTLSPITKAWNWYMDEMGDCVLARLGATHQTLGAAAAVQAGMKCKANVTVQSAGWNPKSRPVIARPRPDGTPRT